MQRIFYRGKAIFLGPKKQSGAFFYSGLAWGETRIETQQNTIIREVKGQ